MWYLLATLGLLLVGYLFWQQDRQSERAKAAITRQCQKWDLQLLNVSLQGHKLKTPDGVWRWHSVYLFEFSSLGDDCYQGQLQMQGLTVMDIQFPPYRM